LKRVHAAPLAVALLALAPVHAATPQAARGGQALEILKRSIAFKTVEGAGQVPAYAEYLAGVLKAGGIAAEDIRIERHGETATLVARWRGAGKGKPILLAGHMDVVAADPKDWTRDPFTPVVEKGFVFGRGVLDNKLGIATMVAAMVQMKAEGFRPSRDVVLALSGDEETAQATTAVLAQQLKGAELLLNSDAGGALLDESGKPVFYGLQAAEKTYADFEVTVTNPGGHSSRPTATNAIYDLSKAIDRIAAYRFPPQASELTRAFFVATAARTPGEVGQAMKRFAANPNDTAAAATLAASPEYVGQIGTTCVATMVNAGHARNALPQRATANVNCRIFPGVEVETVRAKLQELVQPAGAKVTVVDKPMASDASPLRDDVMAAVRKAVDARAPGLPIVPQMSAGTTDSLYFRAVGIPSYGVGGAFIKSSDEFAHGLDERVPVESVEGSVGMWKVMLRELAK
jgi:acetylornithine deacetylase/succinyl-diaminopimelate desuccinylase-like protein